MRNSSVRKKKKRNVVKKGMNTRYALVKDRLGLRSVSGEEIEHKAALFFNGSKRYNARFFIVIGMIGIGLLAGFLVSYFTLNDITLQVRDFSYIIAVLLAGIISLLISETNKENEINKHREKWCSELRGYVSEFSTAVNSLARNIFQGVGDYRKPTFKVVEELYENTRDCEKSIMELDRLQHILAMYLYPEWDDKPEMKLLGKIENIKDGLEECIKEIKDMRNEMSSAENGRVFSALDARGVNVSKRINKLSGDDLEVLVIGVKVYLDSEWKDIKRGRFWFKLKRGFFISLMVFLLSLFVTFIINNPQNEMVTVDIESISKIR